jgi:2-polyprenyl-6-methoxyphenol hydroxylase-like FAD-dependent oxidoreductase
LADVLFGTGGSVVRWRLPYDEAWSAEIAEASARDNSRILPGVPGAYCGSHPAACDALSRAAEEAGAVVVRGAYKVDVRPSRRPEVGYSGPEGEQQLQCRLIVGADGRRSMVRERAAIDLHGAVPTHLISGLLVDDASEWPQDKSSSGTQGDVMFLVFPQGGARLRVYLCNGLDQTHRYTGGRGALAFLAEFHRLTCLPWAPVVAQSRPIGPCATVPGDDTWTESPIAPGVVLIGDAAGHNDPILGQGLAIALRDARVVSELLLAESDWDERCLLPYAAERRERMRRLRLTAALYAALQADFSSGASARRARFHERVRAGTDLTVRQALLAAAAGPEMVADEVFTSKVRAQLLQ